MQTRLVDYHDLNASQRQQLGYLEVTREQTQFSGDIYTALNTLLVNPSPNVCGFVLLGDDKPVGFSCSSVATVCRTGLRRSWLRRCMRCKWIITNRARG